MSSLATPHWLRAAGAWSVDPIDSSLEFRVRHLGVTRVRGRFGSVRGAIFPGSSPHIIGLVRVASLDTHHPRRDATLLSPRFLDADAHPEIVFAATQVGVNVDGLVSIRGLLTLKAVTRPITLHGSLDDAIDLDGYHRVTFELRGELDRRDFRLGQGRLLDRTGLRTGNRVELTLRIGLIRDAPLASMA